MARVKVRLADNIARVVFIDPEATKGATLDTNLFMADGSVATPGSLRSYLGLGDQNGTLLHKELRGLQQGDDHPQYTMWAARETIKGQWDFVSAIWGADGTVALPEFTFTADTNTGMYRIGADNFGFATNGTRRLDIDTARIDFTLPMRGPDGSDGTPTYSFTNYPNTGMTIFPGHAPEKELGFSTGGVHRLDISSLGIDTGSSCPFRGSGGSAALPDYNFWIADGTSTNSGMYRSGSVNLGWSISGTHKLLLSATALTSDVVVQGPSGAATGPTFSFSGDPNTGIFSNGADDLGFAVGGNLTVNINTSAVISTLPVRTAGGSAASPAFSFSGDSNTGVYSVGADVLGFSSAGSLRYQIGASGQLGIGGATYGTSGQVLTSGGASAAPSWQDPPEGGGGGIAYVNTSVPAGNTVANTVTETAFSSSYTIAANQLQSGSVIRLKLFGVFGTDAVAPTLRVRAKVGGSTVLDTGAVTLTAALTNQGWALEGTSVCFTNGATGTLESQGLAEFATAAAAGQLVNLENTSTTTIDTTGTLALTVTVEWGTADADNTITLREMTVDLLDMVSPTTAASAAATYLTTASETSSLPNSRRLLAGTNITFDDTVAGQRTISASGSGGGSPPTIRGSALQSGASSSLVITLPAGSAAGDLAIITTNHAWNANTPSGWSVVDSSAGSFTNGAAFAKVLDSTDISTGSVTVTYGGADAGGVAILVVFQTGTYSTYARASVTRTSGSLSSLFFPVGTILGSMSLLTHGGTRDNATITHGVGTTQQSAAATGRSAKVSVYTPSITAYAEQTVSYSASSEGTYTIGIVVNGA